MLARLPEFFNKQTTGMFYKILTSVASQLEGIHDTLEEMPSQMLINTASGESLQKFGDDYNTPYSGGTDDEYREKILATYSQGRLSKRALSDMLTSLGLSGFEIEEHIYDRWVLTSSDEIVNVESVTVDSTNKTIIYMPVDEAILANTLVDVYLLSDVDKTHNYGIGATWTAAGTEGVSSSGAIIELDEELPEDVSKVKVYFAPAGDQPSARVLRSFVMRDTIVRTEEFLYTVEVSDIDENAVYLKDTVHVPTPPVEFSGSSIIAEELKELYNFPRTVLNVMYFDEFEKILYEWKDALDENGNITISEENRTDNRLNKELDVSVTKDTIVTDYAIAKVHGVYLQEDYRSYPDIQNYYVPVNGVDPYFDGKTIYLQMDLPKERTSVIVDYTRYPIKNYKEFINLNLLPSTGASVTLWNKSTQYYVGDIVSFLGNQYVCILDNTNTHPSLAEYWEETKQTMTTTGWDDPRYTVQLLITSNILKWGQASYGSGRKWGELKDTGLRDINEYLDKIKAAGVRVTIAIVKFGAIYGVSNYGKDAYGPSPFWRNW